MSKKKTNSDIREQRIAIQREIAELIVEQQAWYHDYLLPSAAEARSSRPASKFAGKSAREVAALSLEDADRLDDSPTGRFEKGRAHIEHLSTRIRSLRTQEEKLASYILRPKRDPQIDWVARLNHYARKVLDS